MTIQWFPGHMAKARREVSEKLKLIDVVIELVDARIPLASRNPMIDELVQAKPRLVLLNKADLADESITSQWTAYFKGNGVDALAVNSQTGKSTQQIINRVKQLAAPKIEKMKAKGIRNPRAIRVLILGIPNVGKSTLINRLANKKAAKTGDRPGVTTAQQWIKVGKEIELLDTPGILWPKFEDQLVGLKLAATGAIKDPILDFHQIALYILNHLSDHYPHMLKDRYHLELVPENMVELLGEIASNRGFIISGGEVDYDKAAEVIIRELRSGKIGHISFESPADYEMEEHA